MVREKVKAGAAWFVNSFQELIDQLAPLENGASGHTALTGAQPNGINGLDFRKGASLTGFDRSNSLHPNGCSNGGSDTACWSPWVTGNDS